VYVIAAIIVPAKLILVHIQDTWRIHLTQSLLYLYFQKSRSRINFHSFALHARNNWYQKEKNSADGKKQHKSRDSTLTREKKVNFIKVECTMQSSAPQ